MFLVLYRYTDEPYLEVLTEEKIIKGLNDEWGSFTVLTQEFFVTNKNNLLEKIPANSILIVKCAICTKQPITSWGLGW